MIERKKEKKERNSIMKERKKEKKERDIKR